MAVRAKTDLKVVGPDHEQAAAEAEILEAAKISTPMVQRLSSHRDRIQMVVKELESERFDLLSRRDHLRRQAQAVEEALTMNIDDIEATLSLYETGLNSIPLQS